MAANSEIDVNALVEDHSDYLLSFAMSKLKDIDLDLHRHESTF